MFLQLEQLSEVNFSVIMNTHFFQILISVVFLLTNAIHLKPVGMFYFLPFNSKVRMRTTNHVVLIIVKNCVVYV